ncbi:MAG: Lrp/AsnC family transcriptional regulator [Candidatus Diapherotrites archaeon]|nr:Lrp/AsnC family transcriptional regulator [Candidatus Diapherotrites archaeon]
MDLSPLDLRILRYCNEQGVLESERSIARTLRISPSTLSFKLRRFESKGIINAYRLRVDFQKLGFSQVAWVFFSVPASKDIVKLMNEVLSFPQVHVACFASGQYQLAFKTYCKTEEEVSEVVRKIKKACGLDLCAEKVFLAKEVMKSHSIVSGNGVHEEISGTDYLILQEKMLDPSKSLAEIAKKLGLHKNTVLSRWTKLLGNKVVLKKTPIIDPDLHSAIGIDFSSICLFRARENRREELGKELLSLREVHELSSTDSGKDFLAVVRSENMSSFYRLLNGFYSDKKLSGLVESVEANILLRTDSRRHTYLKDLKLAK